MSTSNDSTAGIAYLVSLSGAASCCTPTDPTAIRTRPPVTERG
ncbi:hypothetical protein [Dactylosporangium sp. NPDC050588]